MKDRTYCYECKTEKFVDTSMGWYCCKICGDISGKNTICDLNYKDIVESYNRVNCKYDRINQFTTQLNNNVILDKPKQRRMINMFETTLFYLSDIISGRKNCIKYKYIIYKLLELIKERIDDKNFLLPKTSYTIKKYDKIWEQVCEKANWQYYRTI